MATDASHSRKCGGWAAIFEDGRSFSGGGSAFGSNDAELYAASNDAEVYAAIMALKQTVPGMPLVLVADAQALLEYPYGTGKITQWPVWTDFREAIKALGSSQMVIRRANTLTEEAMHHSAHNLAAAALSAAIAGADPTKVADKGWCNEGLSGDLARVLQTKNGIELILLRKPPDSWQRALEYETSRLSEQATVYRLGAQTIVFRPGRSDRDHVLIAVERLIKDLAAST